MTTGTGGEVRLVGDKIELRDAKGTVLHTAPNEDVRVRSAPVGQPLEPVPNGWVAYAYAWGSSNPPFNNFVTTWKVPPAPSKWSYQTVFLFNSIEPSSGNAILQPVLQYGPSAAGGWDYWSVASWWLGGGHVYYTPLVKVTPGKELTGVMKLTSFGGGVYNYTSEFDGIPGTKLTVSGAPDVLTWATETLEVYNVGSSADLPPGLTSFWKINLRTTAGTPSVKWYTVSNAGEGITTKVVVQGATNAQVTITY